MEAITHPLTLIDFWFAYSAGEQFAPLGAIGGMLPYGEVLFARALQVAAVKASGLAAIGAHAFYNPLEELGLGVNCVLVLSPCYGFQYGSGDRWGSAYVEADRNTTVIADAKLQAAFLLLGQVSPEALNAKIRRAEEDDALNAAGDPIRLAELDQLKKLAAIRGPHELWLGNSQIIALETLPTPHLRKALLLMKSVRQEDLNGLILHAQYGVTLEKDELRLLMADTATYDRGRHTSQEPAQQDNDDAEAE